MILIQLIKKIDVNNEETLNLQRYLKENLFLKKKKFKKKIHFNFIKLILLYLIKKTLFFILLNLLKKKFRWNVNFFFLNKKKKNFFSLKSGIKIKNPSNAFLADPFTFQHKKKNYIILEEFNLKNQKGVISLYEISGKKYKRIGIILNENFHLSYPYLFKFNKKLYLIPESSEKKEIRIYQCVKFPFEWKLKKVLFKNLNAVDPMIFKNKGIWWLFFNSKNNFENDYSKLNIYFNKENPLSSKWKKSGIKSLNDLKLGRNGGILNFKKNQYRITQNESYFFYGKSLSINQILKLTTSEYKEKKVKKIEPRKFNNNNILGVHHLNNNNNLVCYDTLEIK